MQEDRDKNFVPEAVAEDAARSGYPLDPLNQERRGVATDPFAEMRKQEYEEAAKQREIANQGEQQLRKAQINRELMVAFNTQLNSLLMARDHYFSLVENPYANDAKEMKRMEIQIGRVTRRITELMDVEWVDDLTVERELKADEEKAVEAARKLRAESPD